MFITNQPAMFVDDYLVVSDLHLGITYEFYKKGISVPSQVRSFLERLHELKKTSKTSKLVVAGDLKHKVPGTSWQEFMEIPDFLKRLDFEKIILTKGNHDAGIEKLIYGSLKQKVKLCKSFPVGDYLFTHGHRRLLKQELRNINHIVIGHNQPAVRFHDSIGASYVEQAWVRGPIRIKGTKKSESIELIIMPAFNLLAGAGIVNSGKFRGPVAKALSPKNAHAYLLDGTNLGTIEDLKIKE